jgi:outer membrane biosynthesis protein TonB
MAGILRKPKPKPKAKAKKPPPRPAPKPAGKPAAPASTEADHSTLDVAGMASGGAAGGTETEVSDVGGPGQDDAVFSTGPGQASSLHYHQATTYQQVYADQIAQASQTEGGQ